ncbi:MULTISPECIES: recombinase family protein [unclassified Streptomyces]|uniref:recombinase family protein n=1 Tax=unclassified Streptomyces TaxID=2593676 RepID=UPI002E1727C5|nr:MULTISPECIES: recombinase family protein [unclassified Streptomyces]
MTATLIGYTRCSLDKQDLTAQSEILLGLGVAEDRIHLDHELTGTNRDRPGLDQALAAVRAGDTLVVPKLDRLARSVPDARGIGDSLTVRNVNLSLGGTTSSMSPASAPSLTSPNCSPSLARRCTGSWSAREVRSPHDPAAVCSYLTDRSRYA